VKRFFGRSVGTHSPGAGASGTSRTSRTSRFIDSLPGRLVLLSGPLLLVLVVIQQFTTLPPLVEVFRKVVAGAFVAGAVWALVEAAARSRRRFLWRVRRKLFLSYVFLGFVPVVLMLAFGLAAAFVVYTNVAGYMFREGIRELVDDVTQIAEATSDEAGGGADAVRAVLERKLKTYDGLYPSLSLAVLPFGTETGAVTRGGPIAVAGEWRHQTPPAGVPTWLVIARRFSGAVDAPLYGTEDRGLIIRAAVPARDGRRIVIADVPVDTDVVARIHARRGTRIRELAFDSGAAAGAPPAERSAGIGQLFRQSTAYMDYTDWDSGRPSSVAIGLEAPASGLYERVSLDDQLSLVRGTPLASTGALAAVLGLLAGLFLIVQGTALVGGVLLARSITSAVHELFVGTERVRSGDFAHRIRIESRDQLGDLADSFNRMSGSIEHLLHVQREKQRLDDELRIAREIQQSLLPTEPPAIEGLSIAALCEPAREVGGDYYDFFPLGPRQLGVLIADVAGKGTSAALYMAELKGLMIALSHQERSPRQLLIEVNRLLEGHLDNRSFITMTYVVVDLDAGTLTCARAGHTPLIFVSGGRSDVIAPEGMVLGLRLPGARERFAELLAEHTCPVQTGDVLVLYTDGVSEAMDAGGELFGDVALAQVIAGQHERDAAGIRERVLRDVRAFVGSAEPHDDMTMIILKITSCGAVRKSA
jgi:sigma-B regulation protein RsbU (phosphoserine phosphatase)